MNRLIAKLLIVISSCFFCGSPLYAQQKMNYWKDADGFLQDQSTLLFNQAYKVLDIFPPAVKVSEERKLALFTLDALLHDTRLDGGNSFHLYMKNIAERVQKELSRKPDRGKLKFIKFYNHSFIVQTREATVAFDLIRGGSDEKPFFPDSIMQAIVDHCDILFVSHSHSDHADQTVAKMFYEQEKTVVTPTGMWENISPYIKHLRDTTLIRETIRLYPKNASLFVNVFPGHQDELPNNIYALTFPDGKTIMHTGDQYNTDDEKWIEHIREKVKVDVLLIHCWAASMGKVVDGINPSLVICGHENEMEHSINHREPYWLSFRRMQQVTKPCIIMAWGEPYLK